jgi:hypothetical protein
MAWMLVAVVFGAPIPTGLAYKSIGECFEASDGMTLLYVENFNSRLKNLSGIDRQAEVNRIPRFTCIPSHSDAGR